MNANRKITFIIFIMVSILVASIVVLVALGYREIGYDGAKKRAHLTAKIVKDSLTSHMVNGIMDKRDLFLDGMKRLDGVQDLWIVRSPSVNEQFGSSSLDEQPRDEIDVEVLKSGIERELVVESLKSATLRVTIPYIASTRDKPNCLECHNAKEGDVLGAISLTFDIQDDRIAGVITLVKIIGTAAIFLVLILIFISKMIRPYTSVFDTIIQTLKRVHEGDYSVRVNEGIYKEDKEAAKWLNEIVEKLETVLGGIEKNLTAFVHNRSNNTQNNDKLLTAKEIIQDITDIYNFKKTIETDLEKDDIYYRLVQVFENHLKIDKFIIYENDLLKNDRRVAYSSKNSGSCCSIKRDIKDQCRAERTDQVVQSSNFPGICRSANCDDDAHYVCIPFQVSEQKSITINILCDDKDELKHVKYQIGIIKKYLEEAKPILESRMLMDVLRERNFIDGLTGLYNRKYFDEFVDKKMPKELVEGGSYAVIMLDIDYFKMVNDTYGHDAGDAILLKLSSIMRESLCDEDFVVRFGGEEFLIVHKNPDEESTHKLCAKINETFGKHTFKFDNVSFNKTVSIGYALFPEDTNQIWRCIKYADLSLYEAKNSGRNRIIKFSSEFLKNSDGGDY